MKTEEFEKINNDKDSKVYRHELWVAKEEVKELKRLLKEAERRYDRKIQVNGGQSWYEWIVDWLDDFIDYF